MLLASWIQIFINNVGETSSLLGCNTMSLGVIFRRFEGY